MYPNLYYAFKDLFGVDWSWLRFINSFGFFVAFAFLGAAYVLTLELRKRERMGFMQATEIKKIVGKPASFSELALNFILAFLFSYKLVGLFTSDSSATADPQTYIFSSQGNFGAGLLFGLLFAGLKYYEKNKVKLAKPEERIVRMWPHDRVGDLVILAAIFGFLGAKVFHNLENWNEFWKSPIEALLSFSGLTFYGGLICATVAIVFFARKHKISVRHLADSIAPALMLAYAIGRIGCQVSGDGDWGIINSAYISTPEAKIELSDSTRFRQALDQNSAVYMDQSNYSSADQIHHKNVPGPKWLPKWMIAYNYPHNVIGEGVAIKGCEGQYCRQLPLPVFPTAFYETVVCLILFAFLISIRNRLMVVPGALGAVYLFVNGLERFFIEKIRVNTQYDIMGFHPTQAELISTLLMITGIILFLVLARKKGKAAPAPNV